MKILKGIALMAVFTLLASCTTITKVDHCTGWEPVMPHKGDSLTQATSDAQLKQVCTGYKFGCWKPEGIEQACSAKPVK